MAVLCSWYGRFLNSWKSIILSNLNSSGVDCYLNFFRQILFIFVACIIHSRNFIQLVMYTCWKIWGGFFFFSAMSQNQWNDTLQVQKCHVFLLVLDLRNSKSLQNTFWMVFYLFPIMTDFPQPWLGLARQLVDFGRFPMGSLFFFFLDWFNSHTLCDACGNMQK